MTGSLPDAGGIWRRWVLMAAAATAAGSSSYSMSTSGDLGFQHPGGGRCGMRSIAGQRAVIWGRCPDFAPLTRDDLVDLAPDWAVDDRGADALVADGTTCVVWFRRGHWGAVAGEPPLPPAVRDDAALAEAWRDLFPDADPADLDAALHSPDRDALTRVWGRHTGRGIAVLERGFADAQRPLSPTASEHLREAIHAQMKAASEIGDRGHPQRPTLLRQWASIHVTGERFRFAVHLSDHALHTSATNTGLTDAEQRSLANVLAELREAERTADTGAWLFCRVRNQGRSVSLERVYDHWPSWYVPADPTGLPRPQALAREMARRDPGWVPTWSTLLPVR